MKQADLFEQEQDHKGIVYNPKYDYKRLKNQIERVWAVMVSHDWLTLSEIASKTGDPEASISARLRALRTEEYGSHIVMKRPRGERQRGLWEYKLVENTSNES
ncbi:MAG: hypothetical protein VW270_31270 [Candidatus Poseidoniales archaeon]